MRLTDRVLRRGQAGLSRWLAKPRIAACASRSCLAFAEATQDAWRFGKPAKVSVDDLGSIEPFRCDGCAAPLASWPEEVALILRGRIDLFLDFLRDVNHESSSSPDDGWYTVAQRLAVRRGEAYLAECHPGFVAEVPADPRLTCEHKHVARFATGHGLCDHCGQSFAPEAS